MIQLQPTLYSCLRGLVNHLAEFNLILEAVIEDTTPAWVAVDQVEQPGAAILFTSEGSFLVGNAGNQGFVDDLRDFFWRAETEPGYWQGGPGISLCVDSPAWEQRLPEIFPRRQPAAYMRQHYLCTARSDPAWRARILPGYTVERIERPDRPDLAIPAHVTEWIATDWRNVDDMLANGGFAFGTIHQNAVVSWSVADAVAGKRCEIGIQTLPDYRRQGLATLTTLAAVDYALASGLEEVGWHCNANNLGSIGTALNAGFKKERDYVAYWYSIRAQD